MTLYDAERTRLIVFVMHHFRGEAAEKLRFRTENVSGGFRITSSRNAYGQTPLCEQVGQQVANKFMSGTPDTNVLYN